MLANNETGVIMPVAEISKFVIILIILFQSATQLLDKILI